LLTDNTDFPKELMIRVAEVVHELHLDGESEMKPGPLAKLVLELLKKRCCIVKSASAVTSDGADMLLSEIVKMRKKVHLTIGVLGKEAMSVQIGVYRVTVRSCSSEYFELEIKHEDLL
ncbi:hypothetical protein PFISCL1PPCAC_29176, partial [Pristionchus fissidentatus]